MKKTAAVVTVVLLLLTAQACLAVDLEAGWYVMFQDVDLLGPYGPDQGRVRRYCATPTGQFGPILVENTGPPDYGRRVTILEGFSATPGTVLFEDYGRYSDLYPQYPEVHTFWMTEYVGSCVQLQVSRHSDGVPEELVWSQTGSGQMQAGGNIWNTYPLQPGEDVVFRVVVVPEPCGVASLALGIGICMGLGGRRARR